MARLWDKGLPLDERILRFTAGEDHKLDERLVAYDARASIAHARMLEKQQLLSAADCDAICAGLDALAGRARGRRVVDRARRRGRAQRARAPAHGAHRRGRRPRASRPVAQRSGARRAASLSARRDRRARERRRMASWQRSSASRRSKAASPCPATRTCSRRCRARSRSGRAASAPSSPTTVQRLQRVLDRTELNPLGSAAGYGVPNLPLDREATRAALGFARTQEPVTAVQLSRGKAEAALVFEIAVLLGDLGRLASDLLLFYTSEFAYVSLPAEMTTGSSIMPQKRNPDVFELVRGAQATALGALQEILGHHGEADVRLSPRLAAPESAAVPQHRSRGRRARDHGARAAGRALPAGEHRARARALRGRAGERARRQGRPAVSRGVPAHRRAARAAKPSS